jgi:biopolymer transport protein ExbD
MARRHKISNDDEAVDLTPMLDVVFILLIFFVVTASFVKEAGVDVERPTAASTTSKEHASVLIAITETGEVWIQKRRIDVRAVRANVERLMAENPQGSVVIQADSSAKTGTLIEVLDQVKLAGAQVAISTIPGPE